jgi:adenylate cyclase
MYTDMVGYTALGQRNESLSLALVEEQRQLIRPILIRHNGREVKTIGDAFLVEFQSALDAVRCAYDVQRATREFNISVPEERRLHLRVGIHLGDVVESLGDISGDAVNVASRIESLAEDGGVCLTRQIYDHVHNKFDLPLVSLGPKSLKNVSAPVETYRMEMPWGFHKTSQLGELDKRRIAVLPFVNMSPDPVDEFFADGMTEELITAISGLQGLQVIARTSVMSYKGGGRTKLSTIGDDLRVGTVLEGSVRKAGNRIRVTAQLVDVPTESHLWSEKYDRELDDVFKIQDDIAGKIAQALKIKLILIQESGRKQTENMEAYALYLKGRSLWNSRSREGVLEAIKLFQEATRIDPSYAKAYSGLADAYHMAAWYGYMDRTEGNTKRDYAIAKALELDDALPEAHASLGNALSYGLSFQEAQLELRRAIELNPSYASAHHWLSLCLIELGKLNEAIDEMKEARELDPLSPVITDTLAQEIAYYLGKVDQALEILDKLTQREPNYPYAYLSRSYCFAMKRMKSEAFADLQTYSNFLNDEESHKVGLAWLHGWFGEEDQARHLLQEVLQDEQHAPTNPARIARVYAIVGEKDEFFAWVDRAIGIRQLTVGLLRYDPSYQRMKDDPRFPKIFEKLGLNYAPG